MIVRNDCFVQNKTAESKKLLKTTEKTTYEMTSKTTTSDSRRRKLGTYSARRCQPRAVGDWTKVYLKKQLKALGKAVSTKGLLSRICKQMPTSSDIFNLEHWMLLLNYEFE